MHTEIKVKMGNTFSAETRVTRGLRQRDMLQLILFNLALEKAIQNSNLGHKGMKIGYATIRILVYADDIEKKK